MSLTRPAETTLPPKSESLVPVPRRKSRLRRVLILLVPLLLLGAGLFLGLRKFRSPALPSTHTVSVTRGDVETKITETGIIEPLKKVEVKSKVGGRMEKLYVQEGSLVRAGQLVAEIEPTEINSQVEQIRAQLNGAQARLERTQRSVPYQSVQTRTGIDQAEEALRSATSRLRSAEEEYRTQPRLTESAIRQARAELQSSRDSLELLRTATQPQDRVMAESSVNEAQASLNKIQGELDRQKKLLAKKYLSQQEVDDTTASLAAAQARLDQMNKRKDVLDGQQSLEIRDAGNRVRQAQAALDSALAGRSQIALKKEAVEAAKAEVQRAKSQLVAARSSREQDRMRGDDVAEARASVIQLENQLREVEVRQKDTRLVAPQSGTVTKRYIEEGELVMSGVNSFSAGNPIMQVADLSHLLVKLSVNEVDVHKVRAGLPVEISIDGAKGVIFGGKVTRVAPAAVTAAGADNNNQSNGQGGVIRFAVEVAVDQPDPRLKPGMTAKCNLIVARKRKVLRLPVFSVKEKGSKQTVSIITPAPKGSKTGEKSAKRDVVLGLRGDAFVEVVSGLKVGEKIKPAAFSGPKRESLNINF